MSMFSKGQTHARPSQGGKMWNQNVKLGERYFQALTDVVAVDVEEGKRTLEEAIQTVLADRNPEPEQDERYDVLRWQRMLYGKTAYGDQIILVATRADTLLRGYPADPCADKMVVVVTIKRRYGDLDVYSVDSNYITRALARGEIK